MATITVSPADRRREMVERTRAKAEASEWLIAEKTEIERDKADREARAPVRAATLPPSAVLGGAVSPRVDAPSFEPRELPYGKQFCAALLLPDGRDRQIGAFKTAAEAQAWIDTKSASWLASQ